MNQILNIDLNKNIETEPSSENLPIPFQEKKINKKKVFSIQFILSIIAIFIFTSFYWIYKHTLLNTKRLSDNIISNYNLSKLYSNYTSQNINTNQYKNPILGIIEIPKINLYYPIFSELNDNLLKIAPCRFSGEMPLNLYSKGNLCIAGHNYENREFFSNLSNLSINDEIYIYNNEGIKFCYYVFQIYEVKSNDLSPLESSFDNSLELTLITCNNFNNNRIVVKAKTEST